MNCHCGKVALYIVNGKGKCAEHKGEEKMLTPLGVRARKRRAVGVCIRCGVPCGDSCHCPLHARMANARVKEYNAQHKPPKA